MREILGWLVAAIFCVAYLSTETSNAKMHSVLETMNSQLRRSTQTMKQVTASLQHCTDLVETYGTPQ